MRIFKNWPKRKHQYILKEVKANHFAPTGHIDISICVHCGYENLLPFSCYKTMPAPWRDGFWKQIHCHKSPVRASIWETLTMTWNCVAPYSTNIKNAIQDVETSLALPCNDTDEDKVPREGGM